MQNFKDRAEEVLSDTFRGLHNCPKIHKFYEGHAEFERWEVNTCQDLSTWDSDTLTRLVISAHDQCVRVSIGPSGPRMVKISVWPGNTREGFITRRHPTIEEAIEKFRGRK